MTRRSSGLVLHLPPGGSPLVLVPTTAVPLAIALHILALRRLPEPLIAGATAS
ncbi:hypothetical protein [Kutzneria sp. NPDC051319]|uniref:hypothetical protein n=1 Tax=Kutzneria sp. NPDC051319 TaxID=3155047 RepID=UPI00343B0CC9